MKEVVSAIREIILKVDRHMEECIKWQAPTFVYKGNMASFFPRSKKHASLMFHTGASLAGKHRLLTGEGNTSRHLKLASVEDVKAAKKEIEAIVKDWCNLQDASESKKPAKKKKK